MAFNQVNTVYKTAVCMSLSMCYLYLFFRMISHNVYYIATKSVMVPRKTCCSGYTDFPICRRTYVSILIVVYVVFYAVLLDLNFKNTDVYNDICTTQTAKTSLHVSKYTRN